jgi:flagellar biosynthesis/type III secretory pathway protein FliH
MIKTKKIALALSAVMFLQPVMFAVDSALTKEIVALELELTKMKTRTGEYADLSEAALERKITRTKKQLDKKKAKAKKEAQKDAEAIKKGTKKAGEDIKDAGKKAGKELKDAGKEIGNTFKEIFD